MSLCGCGCGQPVKEGKKYIFNHYWIGKHRSEATKKKIGKGNKGKLAGDKNPSKIPEVRKKIKLKRLKDWRNPEYRNKMIEGRRRYYLNGGRNSNYGKPLSDDHRRKIGEAQKGEKGNNWKGGNKTVKCIVCGKLFEVTPCRKDEAKYCSTKCYSTAIRGPNSVRWLGGKSFEPYSPEFNSELKRLIKERDGHRCLWCGDDGEDLGYLQIHHIDYDKKNSAPDNLMTLCTPCHMKTNHNREFWQNCLSELIAN